MSDTEVKFTAHVFDNGNITLEEKWPHQDLRGQVAQQIIRTKEKAIRDALIMLGWTPPEGDGLRQPVAEFDPSAPHGMINWLCWPKNTLRPGQKLYALDFEPKSEV